MKKKIILTLSCIFQTIFCDESTTKEIELFFQKAYEAQVNNETQVNNALIVFFDKAHQAQTLLNDPVNLFFNAAYLEMQRKSRKKINT